MKLQSFKVPVLLVLVSLAGFVAGHLCRGEDMRKAMLVALLASGIVAIATFVVGHQGLSRPDES